MIRIEFIGTPGVGKTTIRNNVVKRLKLIDKKKYLTDLEALYIVSKYKADKAYRYILRSLPNLLAHKVFSGFVLNRTIWQHEALCKFLSIYGESLEIFLSSEENKNLSLADRTAVLDSYLKVGSRFECIKDFPSIQNKVIFFDEGFVQRSLMFRSYYENEIKKKRIFRYLRNVPLPDIIIYVKADISNCHERMKKRPSGLTNRLKNKDNTAINEFLKLTDEHFYYVTKWIKQNNRSNIIKVVNDNDLQHGIDDLTSKLATML